MAQNEVNQFDEVDASNVDISGTTVVQTTMYPFHVPVAFRNLMGALKRTFRSDLFRLRDSTTQTKLLAFDLSAITAATTRTVGVPDKNGTMAMTSDVTAGVSVTAMDSRPNMSVNGSLTDSQENGNTLGTTSNYFYADQHFMSKTGSLGLTAQRVQLADGSYVGEFKCTVLKAVLGATDFATDSENIEGSRPEWVAAGFGTAGALPFLYRKKVNKPAGLYHFHFANRIGNLHCSVPYTITAPQAGVDTVVTVTVPPCTTGTWSTADGEIGITCDDVLVAGSSLTGGSASTWSASAFLAASTQFNFQSSTSNTARHTDFGMKRDPSSTGVYGAYRVGEVDAKFRSERYYEPEYYSAWTYALQGANTSPNSFYHHGTFKVAKAKIPVLSLVTGVWAGTPTFYPTKTEYLLYRGSEFYAQGVSGAISIAANARLT